MATESLFEAMQSFRQAHCSTALERESFPHSPLSGQLIARSFAESANKSLRQEKLTQLQHFFTDASFRQPGKFDSKELSQELDSRLATFSEQESHYLVRTSHDRQFLLGLQTPNSDSCFTSKRQKLVAVAIFGTSSAELFSCLLEKEYRKSLFLALIGTGGQRRVVSDVRIVP